MKLKYLVLSTALVFSSLIGIAAQAQPAVAFSGADCPAGSLYKTNKEAAKAGPTNVADCNLPKEEEKKLMDRVTTIINVIVGTLGIVTVAMIVLGGITYATSQGDAAKATKAKNTILFGIVGLIIALLAFAIVNFVLKSIF